MIIMKLAQGLQGDWFYMGGCYILFFYSIEIFRYEEKYSIIEFNTIRFLELSVHVGVDNEISVHAGSGSC